MNARTTALSALIACRKQGAWADGILKEYIARDRLDRRDAALASRLCYGVLQNRMLLDHYISACLTGSIKKLHPIVLDILRIGMYQLLFMDKVPDSAAVNECVKIVKKSSVYKSASFVNAILRSVKKEDIYKFIKAILRENLEINSNIAKENLNENFNESDILMI